ncbi:cytochrome c oxidase accessory protein CcoG [Methylotenera sp.]|uniref:cytochrome c oxidase accessory protein CcoG n=1 Tax=Methylotenera sp. TaxID=2051956 RepID=UPI002EDA4DF3
MKSATNPKALPTADAKKQATVIHLYAAAEKIYPRSTFGFFTKWRWAMIWLTQIVFYGMPWLEWGNRQALLFDLEAKRFYIFNLVLYPQDLIYLTAILIIAALSLFLFTAIAGRLWCGYACPQTVYTEMFLWIEAKIEGDRAARIKLDNASLSSRKLLKKGSKHFVWIALSLWTGFTFVGYFSPIRELGSAVVNLGLGPWETFWIGFYGFATYGNAGFMREQVCKYMCPYARFQSAMFDDDTLVVTYDEARGEPRGSRSRKADLTNQNIGSCIDCSMCVQVCPTGIDIRKGLQYECIGCGACADVCDTVMDKMGYARGLIKYSTQTAIVKGWSHTQMLKRILRPRVMIYAAALVLLVITLCTSLWLRAPFKVDVIRDRGVMARLAEGGMLENVYRLQIMNATESAQHYQLSATGLDGLVVQSDVLDANHTVVVNAAETRGVPVRLQIPDGSVKSGSHAVTFSIHAVEDDATVTEKSIFLVPR